MWMVVGYVPTSPLVRSDGRVLQAAGWNVMMLGHGQTIMWSWALLLDMYLLEDWETK